MNMSFIPVHPAHNWCFLLNFVLPTYVISFFFFFLTTTILYEQRTYDIFRTLGLKMLPVVNRHNQCVGTITRTDICNDNLALTLLQGGQNKKEL